MAGEQQLLDYAAIIADLEAKRAALDATIGSLRAALALGAIGAGGDFPASPGTPFSGYSNSTMGGEVPAGAFLGKSIPEAAKLYLQLVKKKQTSGEISDALRKGGMESSSKNFAQIVHSILDRARKNPNSGLVKLDRSYWGLAEWYPAAMRASATTTSNGKRSKKRQKRSGKPAAMKQPETGQLALPSVSPVPAAPASVTPITGTEPRVLQQFAEKPGMELSAQEVASNLGMKIQTVHLVLGKLASKKQIEKTAPGVFRMGAQAAAV